MKFEIRIDTARFVVSTLCAASFLLGASLSAQDPFGEPAAQPAAEKQAPAAAKLPEQDAAKTKAKGGGAAQKIEAPLDPSRYDLSVRAVLESDPQTPAQLVRAAKVLVDLGQPDLAKGFILKLHEAALDDAALAELVRQLGSGPFLKIAGETRLEPEGREIADRAIKAAGQAARDPARLAQLVQQLADPSPENQRRAISELLSAHEHAVPPLLAALNDPARKTLHRRANQALVALGEDAMPPLLAAMEAPDSAAKNAAIQSLGRMGASQATPLLVGLYASPATSEPIHQAAADAITDLHGKLPTSSESITYLRQAARAALSGEDALPANADGNVELWIWDAGKNQLVPTTYSADQARSRSAAQLALRLFELAPDDAENRRLYLVTMLEAEAYRAGRDNPIPRDKDSAFATAMAMGPDAVEDAFSHARERNHTAAATAAAQVLGAIGKADMLVRGGAEPSPLAKALVHRDPRLRFAAAQAIVRLRPAAPFPGLSDLQRALVYFGTSAGERRALVGFPNLETSQQLAGMVSSLGLETDTATNGRALALKATQASDHELILISSRIDRGPLYLILQDLRKHAHTAQTPIIVLAEDDEVGTLRETLRDDFLTTVVLRPRDLDGMKHAVEQALRRAGDRIVPSAVREQQAKEVLASIVELIEAAPRVFDFRSDEVRLAPLLYSPSLSAQAAAVLAHFGTHSSQRSLLNIVNRESQPLALRQTAGLAFGESIRRYGVRLTKDEILWQYDRYNQSQLEDRPTQELLGGVLDAIELPSKVRG